MNAPVQVAESIATVSNKVFNYRFKRDKNGFQRPAVKLTGPVPNAEGVRKILESGDAKQWELLEDAMYDVVRDVLADLVANNQEISQENLDVSKLTWAAIANMPKEDRRSSQIPEELWAAFVEDYVAVMPALTGKTKDQIENATQVFIRKFGPWKSDKAVIKKLLEQLAIYVSTPKAEEFEEILSLLMRRANTYLAADDLAQISQNL